MNIRFFFPTDGRQGVLRAFDKHGKPVDVSRVEFEPKFFHRDAKHPVAYISTTDKKDVEISTAVMLVSAGNGRMAMQDTTEAVESRVDAGDIRKRGADDEDVNVDETP